MGSPLGVSEPKGTQLLLEGNVFGFDCAEGGRYRNTFQSSVSQQEGLPMAYRPHLVQYMLISSLQLAKRNRVWLAATLEFFAVGSAWSSSSGCPCLQNTVVHFPSGTSNAHWHVDVCLNRNFRGVVILPLSLNTKHVPVKYMSRTSTQPFSFTTTVQWL